MDKVGHFLKHELAERLDQMDRLAALVEKHIGIPMENRVWPVLRNRRLVLLTDDAHFATQARFMQKGLCKHVNDILNLKLVGLDIKLISMPLASFGRKLPRTPIDENTANTIASIATQIDDDGLRQALLRVAAVTTGR